MEDNCSMSVNQGESYKTLFVWAFPLIEPKKEEGVTTMKQLEQEIWTSDDKGVWTDEEGGSEEDGVTTMMQPKQESWLTCDDRIEPKKEERVTTMKQPEEEIWTSDDNGVWTNKEGVSGEDGVTTIKQPKQESCLTSDAYMEGKRSMSVKQGESYKTLFLWVVPALCPYTGMLYEVYIRDGSGEIMFNDQPLPLHPAMAKFIDDYKGLVLSEGTSFQGTRFCGRSKLYMLQDDTPSFDSFSPTTMTEDSKGYVFDIETKSLDTFKSPMSSKLYATVISAYGKLYYLASPISYPIEKSNSAFERYDPTTDCWESLPALPSKLDIVGYAVYCGYILFSLGGNRIFRFMAFDVTTRKWHRVKPDVTCRGYPFQGRAVVVDGTIYASSIQYGQVIQFSFDCGTFSISKPFTLPGLKPYEACMLFDKYGCETEYMVHLGNLDFCLVQTAEDYQNIDRQPLWITTFQIVIERGRSYIKTLDSIVLDADNYGTGPFSIQFCFTPDFLEPEEEEEEEEEEKVATPKQPKQETGATADSDTEDEGFSAVGGGWDL